jgi:hypothetical protein
MAKTDVVKHYLESTLADEVFDWENAEPMPLPIVRGRPSEQPPSTQADTSYDHTGFRYGPCNGTLS